MKRILSKTAITFFMAFGMAVLLTPAKAETDFSGKDGEKKSVSAVSPDPETMAFIFEALEENADDDPAKAAKSKEIFTITDLTDLGQLPVTVMSSKTPQNTYDLNPQVFTLKPVSMQSIMLNLKTTDAAPAVITVLDQNGNLMKKVRVKNPAEGNEILLETGNLAKGTYFVEVNQGLKSCYKVVRKNY